MGRLSLGTWAFRRSANALLLTLLVSAIGYAQPSVPPRGAVPPAAPPGGVASFLHNLVGEWIGTCVQSTDGRATDNKYFHAIINQSGPASYETVFEYYRLDLQTGAPIPVGATTMATTVAADGTATNHVTGQAEVLIDLTTLKPEQHDLSEMLRVSLAGGLEGTGSGTIKVSGMPQDAGQSGRVREYRSTWLQSNGVLSMTQHFDVKFRVLFFSKTFTIVAGYTAQRGSDIVGLMKSAFVTANRVSGAPPA
jgi:hypothetical protein